MLQRFDLGKFEAILLIPVTQSTISIKASRVDPVLIVDKQTVIKSEGNLLELIDVFSMLFLVILILVNECLQENVFVLLIFFLYPLHLILHMHWLLLVPGSGVNAELASSHASPEPHVVFAVKGSTIVPGS